jgi:hypothetical protein
LKNLSTQEEERHNKNGPLKAAPVQLKSSGKIATKLSQEEAAEVDQEKSWTDQARAANKPLKIQN